MKAKKIVIPVIIILFIAVGTFICLSSNNGKMFGKASKGTELNDIDRISKMLKESRPTDVFIYGDEIKFKDVDVHILDEIKAEKLVSSKAYKVIIINDLNNNSPLNDSQIELLRNEISKNGVLLIYLGTRYATKWDNPEYGVANLESNLCFAYYSWDGEEKRNIGYWLESDQEELQKYPFSLGESMLYCIEEYMQSGEV